MVFKKKTFEEQYKNLAVTSEIIKLQLRVKKLKLDIEKKDVEIERLKNQKDDSSSSDDRDDYEPVNDYFQYGKYKGRSFKYVAINYPSYAGWAIGLNSPTEHFREFLHFFYKWKLKEYRDSQKL